MAHRPLHKKMCQVHARELYDDKLFKDHPERDECPICMLPLPFDGMQVKFNVCCGQKICKGCVLALWEEDFNSGKEMEDIGTCAFCRTPEVKTHEENFARLQKCAERKQPFAVTVLGSNYYFGRMGCQIDLAKAEELLLEAAEMGDAEAYYGLANIYDKGINVEPDVKKARYYYGLAAIGGHNDARFNLGVLDELAGEFQRAYKHYVIGAKAGDEGCLKKLKDGFKDGFISKDDYSAALRNYQKLHENMKSANRDKALTEKYK